MVPSAKAEWAEILPEHLALFREMQVVWIPIEAGAPYPSPDRTYGTEHIAADVENILRKSKLWKAEGHDEAMALRFHEGALKALPVFLALGQLAPGDYVFETRLQDDDFFPSDWVRDGLKKSGGQKLTVTVGREELILLKHLHVGYVPGMEDIPVNVKRPYGNMTNFELDMADLLGITVSHERPLSEPSSKRMNALHESLQAVMQIFLHSASMKTGFYESVNDAPWTPTSAEKIAADEEKEKQKAAEPQFEEHPFLGVGPYEIASNAEQLKRVKATTGVVVHRIDPSSPAAEMGIQVDDVLLSLNGRKVDDWLQVVKTVRESKPGEPFRISLQRAGKVLQVEGKLQLRKLAQAPLKPGQKVQVFLRNSDGELIAVPDSKSSSGK